MKTLNRQFILFLVARSICIIGDEASIIAVCFKIKADGSWAIAVLFSSLSIAMVFHSFVFAKYLINKSKKNILLFTFIFQIPLTLLLLTSSLPIILISNLMLGLGQAVILSNSSAWLTDLVDERKIKKAYGLLQTTYAISSAIGLLMGGILVEKFGSNSMIILNACSFLLALPLIQKIQTNQQTEQAIVVEQLRLSGLRIIRESQVLTEFALNIFVMIVLIRIYNPLEIFILTDKLGGTPSDYGLVTMLSAVALTIGSAFFTGIIGKRRNLVSWLNKLFFFQGITFALIAFSPSILAFAVLSMGLYVLISGVNSSIGPIIFEQSRKKELAIVHAAMNAVFAIGKMTGILIGGFLGSYFPPSIIVFYTGCTMAFLSIMRFKKTREISSR